MDTKNNINYFGYKNNIKIDAKRKIITKYEVIYSNVHNSQVIENLSDGKNKREKFIPIVHTLARSKIKLLAKKK